jgi:hypothetical protein
VLSLLQWYKALLIVYLTYNLIISAIAFYIITARFIINRVKGSKLFIYK